MLTIDEVIEQLQAAKRDDVGPSGDDLAYVYSPECEELIPIRSVEWDFDGVKLNIDTVG